MIKDIMAQKLTTKVAIFVMIKDAEGRLLLQQRISHYMGGHYDFACSGHVDENETVLEATVRELQEEIGIKADPEDLKLVHINSYYADDSYLNLVFALHKWQGTPAICEPEKCSDLSYFAPDNLPEKCTPSVRYMQQGGFSETLSYSKITPENIAQLMGETT